MEGLKICKHCKEKINDESEMITCSSCRSTYHKECWSKCKCYIICPESEVSDYNLNEDNSEEKTFSEEEMYVGYRKQDYYGPVFRRLKEYDQGTFNFSAFFFSIYWLFYRKMYIEGLVAWGIGSGVKSIIVNILAAITKPTNIGNWFNDWFEWRIMLSKIAEISDTIIGVLVAIIIGCIGNRLYFKKIERLKRKSKPYKAGGTSILFAIIIPLGVTILLTLLEVLIDKL